MSYNSSSIKDNRSSLPQYKDPISASILSFFALVFLFIGVIAIIIPLIASVEIKSQLKNTVFFTVGNQIIDASLVPFVLFAIGCYIFSAILYVLSNIACDTHLTEYNIRQLQLDIKRIQDEQIKQFQRIDDSVTVQSNDVIHQKNSDNNPVDIS